MQRAAPSPTLATGPKLSIVIPTFNAGRTLRACLQSIAAQTYQNIEVLVIDALSTDDTVDIVTEYAGRFASLVLLSEPDRGIYDAMNKGLDRAGGEWRYFLGADDTLYRSTTLEDVVRNLGPDVDLFYGNVFHERQNRFIGAPFDRNRVLGKTICHQAIFYRSALCEAVGRFNLEFRVCADWDFNLRCFSKTGRIHHADVTVCHYSGTGFSSVTEDRHFHENKYRLASAYFGVGMLDRLFTSCRYEFHKKALGHLREKRWAMGGYFYGLYLFHALRNKAGL